MTKLWKSAETDISKADFNFLDFVKKEVFGSYESLSGERLTRKGTFVKGAPRTVMSKKWKKLKIKPDSTEYVSCPESNNYYEYRVALVIHYADIYFRWSDKREAEIMEFISHLIRRTPVEENVLENRYVRHEMVDMPEFLFHKTLEMIDKNGLFSRRSETVEKLVDLWLDAVVWPMYHMGEDAVCEMLADVLLGGNNVWLFGYLLHVHTVTKKRTLGDCSAFVSSLRQNMGSMLELNDNDVHIAFLINYLVTWSHDISFFSEVYDTHNCTFLRRKIYNDKATITFGCKTGIETLYRLFKKKLITKDSIKELFCEFHDDDEEEEFGKFSEVFNNATSRKRTRTRTLTLTPIHNITSGDVDPDYFGNVSHGDITQVRNRFGYRNVGNRFNVESAILSTDTIPEALVRWNLQLRRFHDLKGDETMQRISKYDESSLAHALADILCVPTSKWQEADNDSFRIIYEMFSFNGRKTLHDRESNDPFVETFRNAMLNRSKKTNETVEEASSPNSHFSRMMMVVDSGLFPAKHMFDLIDSDELTSDDTMENEPAVYAFFQSRDFSEVTEENIEYLLDQPFGLKLLTRAMHAGFYVPEGAVKKMLKGLELKYRKIFLDDTGTTKRTRETDDPHGLDRLKLMKLTNEHVKK